MILQYINIIANIIPFIICEFVGPRYSFAYLFLVNINNIISFPANLNSNIYTFQAFQSSKIQIESLKKYNYRILTKFILKLNSKYNKLYIEFKYYPNRLILYKI